MERQKSFSFKPTRLLVFSFTISSSIAFLTFFTIWLFNLTPSILKDARFEFNKTSFGVGLRPLSVQSWTGLTKNVSASSLKSPILTHTHLEAPENTYGFANISVLRMNNESETLKDDTDRYGFDGNFTSMKENVSVTIMEAAITEKVEEKKIRAITMAKSETPRREKVTEIATSEAKVEASSKQREERHSRATSIASTKVLNPARIEEMSAEECDVTKGRWVHDESYPLYSNKTCPFIDEGFDCAGNGRPDKDYMKWRWQPQDCDIPRFNATKMLNLIRGKRLVFVGDSINRNQWESMLCLLMGAVKDPKKVYETHGRRITKEKGNYSFKFVDYKCTVEYYVSHFLVHESKARIGRKRVQTLRIDAIDHGSSRWRGADILIFNTAHWWSHFKTKAGINYYQEGNLVHPKLDVSIAFRRALVAWGAWVDRYINSRKTQVFFRSSAPSHFRGGQWNSGGHCTEAFRPLNETSSIGYSDKNAITEEIIKNMKTPVTYLNITRLSEFRIDGHPSIHGKRPNNRYASSIQDCSHWCLPGTPDTWNQILYFRLLSRTVNKF